jgi:cell wall-associated NlpC family hydrolase
VSIIAGMSMTMSLPAYAYSPDVASLLMSETALPSAHPTPASETQNYQSVIVPAVPEVPLVQLASSSYKVVPAYTLGRDVTKGKHVVYPDAEQVATDNASEVLDRAAVIERAKDFLGVRYVFGGAKPSGFDCSGYARYVYAYFGILLPHSVTGQDEVGKTISAAKAEPGDLVVWNDHSHVGIYAGNGQMYHAPQSGTVVSKSDIFSSAVHFVRISK